MHCNLKSINEKIEAEAKSLNDKIDSNTGHCVNKQLNLEMQIGQVRTMVTDHKMEAITRQDAHNLFEERLSQLKKVLMNLKRIRKKWQKRIT